MIRRAENADINNIVDLHLENLKDGLLFLLGRKILTLFYRDIIAGKDSFILVYVEKDKILGVAAFSINAEMFFSNFKKRHFLQLLFSAIGVLAMRPSFFAKIIFPGTYPAVPAEELMMLFVDQNSRSKGIGAKLIDQMVVELGTNEIRSFKITILSKNASGRKFYEKIGFKRLADFIYFGEARSLYVLEY